MTPHERFLACMRFEPVDRPVLAELGTWDSTVTAWCEQTHLDAAGVMAWQDDCDRRVMACPDFSMRPPFDGETLAADDETFTMRDKMGLVYRQFKDSPDRSMPDYIDFPVKTRADWQRIRKRLDPTDPARYGPDWPRHVASWRRERPILYAYGLVMNYYGGPSLFGFCRMLLGPERLLYAVHDEPDLVEDMMEFATEFAITVLRRALAEAPLSYVQFWEDMCYKTGPLISPEMFKRFMLPRYRRMTDVIRSAGVDVIFVDSDGDVSQLIPLWLAGGINGLLPMEQAAGNDLRAYQREYGRDLLMIGGIDKRALIAGPDAIDRELADKLPLAFEGGYIPTLDHWTPPDVTYDNFMHYWRRRKEMLGVNDKC